MPRASFAACMMALSILSRVGDCRAAGSQMSERLTRGNLGEYRGDKSNPDFWPVRGRREAKEMGDGPRKMHREEETGVFWAGRGRNAEGTEDGPWTGSELWEGWTTADGQKWRELPSPQENDAIVCGAFDAGAKDAGSGEWEAIPRKLCYLKRKSNNLLRELPQVEQFWPVRGKKIGGGGKEPHGRSWQQTLTDPKGLWSPRGRPYLAGKGGPRLKLAPIT